MKLNLKLFKTQNYSFNDKIDVMMPKTIKYNYIANSNI